MWRNLAINFRSKKRNCPSDNQRGNSTPRGRFERLESRALLAITLAHDPTVLGNGIAPNDGFNLTQDSATNLEWLDLTLSTGLSYEDVAAQLGPGGLFEGFRIATAPEIAMYWSDAGIVVPNREQFDDPNVLSLVQAWGVTHSDSFLRWSFANYDESGVSTDPSLFGMAFLKNYTRGAEQAEFMADYSFSSGLFPSNLGQAGTALVRQITITPDSPGEIHGTKYNDLDGDGARDAGEAGLDNLTIYLDLNNNNSLDAGEPSTTTDADGAYSFVGLDAPGDYTVREVQQPGWDQTAPLNYVEGTGQLTFAGTETSGALFGAEDIAASPDSHHVYVVGDGSVTVFERDAATGDLTLVEELADGQTDNQGNVIDGLDGATEVDLSADGEHVYVVGTSENAVAVFARDDATGSLTFVEALFDGGIDGQGATIDGLGGAGGIDVSPDGQHVYVTGYNDNSLAVFSRDAITGRLTWIEALFNGATDSQGNTINGIFTASSPKVSPDGAFVYATGVVQDSVAVFARDTNTGELSFVEFVAEGATDQHGNTIPGLSNAQGLDISPDGKNIYVVGNVDDSVTVFQREPLTGRLTLLEQLVDGGVDSQGNLINGLDAAQMIAVSPGGSHVYVRAYNDVAMVTFGREPGTGRLIFEEVLQQGGSDSQGNVVQGLASPFGVVVTPDGSSVYTADRDGAVVGIFNRDPDVVAPGAHVITLLPGQVVIGADFGNSQIAGGSQPPQIGAQTFTLDENSPGGSVVGTVVATDPDLPNDILTFSLTGLGPDDAQFAITPAGELSILSAPDFENPGDLGGVLGDNVYEVEVLVTDAAGEQASAVVTVEVLPVNDNAPMITSADTIDVAENSNLGILLTATDADSPSQAITFALTTNEPDNALFQINSSGELQFIASPDFETPLDSNGDNVYVLEISADDGNGLSTTQSITVSVQNQASITGVVFVDVNENGAYDANEPGIDGVIIELRDESGAAVLDEQNNPLTAISDDGGFYLFEDLDPDDYQIYENQPSGVADGLELLGSLGGTIPANDTMQLTIARADASDYVFAELGQEVTSGDTATIGFWQNKHGQALITEGGGQLANWLTNNFDNVFGDVFIGADGADVASFFKDQLFKQKGKKVAGPVKVDAQFMATAFATFFTSSNLAGFSALDYGFNVTDTGIGTKVVNVGTNGAAFNVADYSDRTIMQLLLTTNDLTDLPDDISGFAFIYDQDGDGTIDCIEASLRAMANDLYSWVNELGDA